MPALTTPGPVAATAEVAGVQVRVGASDRTDTVVLVEPVNKATKSDVKVAGKPHAAGGDAGPVPAPVARMAAAMSDRSSSFSTRLAAGSHPST
jgi:hypothetical protein